MIINEEKKEIIDDKMASNIDNMTLTSTVPNVNHLKFALIGIFLLTFLCVFLVIFGIITFYNYKHNSTITKGVYINGIGVSNLDKESAKKKLEEYYGEQFSNDIAVVHNDFITYIKASEIGVSIDIDAAVDEAFRIGKNSDIFKTIHTMFNNVNVNQKITFDEQALRDILSNLSPELPDAVVQSGHYIEDNNLIITKGKDGYIIDVDSTFNKIKQNILNLNFVGNPIEIETIEKSPDKIDLDSIYNDIHKEPKDAYFTTDPHNVYPSETGMDFSISLEEAKEKLDSADEEITIPLKILYPSVKTTDLPSDAFPDLLGSFSTKYVSNANRTTNLRLAASKVNGYVLLPGETFSYNSVVGERTISAGYKEADIYEDGQVVKGLGGGICQISSTLFNAVLFANLEIVELYNHQFVPSYVKAGRDATVVYGVKDFKFKNSRNHAVKITCSVSKGVASFEIWGYKEDVEYDIDVYANVTSRTSSYIKSKTYRTLKLNGEIVDNQTIMNATYKVH